MGTKEAFFKALDLIEELGACPWCWRIKRLSKTNIDAFYCSKCDRTFTIENDMIVATWYVIEHGIRVLKSQELDMDGMFWERFVEQIKDQHRR